MDSGHGERLREERLRVELSQVDFIKKLDISKTTVFMWEKGQTHPNSLQLEKMGELGMDVYYIITGTRLPNSILPIQQPEDYYFIPVYSSDLNNIYEIFDTPPLHYHAFRKRWIDSHHYVFKRLVSIKVRGDSMEPTLRDGECVLVNRESILPKTGCIFIVKIGNELLPKYVEVLFNGAVIFKSKNSFYREITLIPDDFEKNNVQIIGEVIQISRDRF